MPLHDTKGKVIVSLLAGATAGIVTGLLLAPETGEETRKSLAGEADKLLKSPWAAKLKNLLAGLAGADHLAADAPAPHPGQARAEANLRQAAAPEPGDLATPAGAGDGRSVAGSENSEFADHDRL